MGGTCPRAPTEAQRWCWTFAATRAHRASLSCPHSSASPGRKARQGNKATTAPSSQDSGEDSRGPTLQGEPQHKAVLCWLQQGESKEGTTAEVLFWAPERLCTQFSCCQRAALSCPICFSCLLSLPWNAASLRQIHVWSSGVGGESKTRRHLQ